MPAAQFIVERVMAAPGEIGLVAVGPLTNLALALCLEPKVALATRQVIVMGGAATVSGNISAAAESNVYNDPEAASLVFSAGWPLTDFIVAIAAFYRQRHARVYGVDGFHVHDPSAVAYAIDPTLFETRRLYVVVDTTGGPNSGRTVADLRLHPAQEPNVDVCLGVDQARLLELYHDRVAGG